MNNQTVLRDERTEVVENASYRLAYYIMACGALVVIAYRGFLFQESLWDLMFLVILSSAVATLYQRSKQVLSQGWKRLAAIIFIVSVILAALLAFLLR
ncbi:MAG: hypothetical protein RMK65_11005 [Anaerolineae bacterium]|nr:hypothetical protein [Anaerolineae bacterium]MDW7992623.1 hypothetical protein [Anaerolineae bacterium]